MGDEFVILADSLEGNDRIIVAWEGEFFIEQGEEVRIFRDEEEIMRIFPKEGSWRLLIGEKLEQKTT